MFEGEEAQKIYFAFIPNLSTTWNHFSSSSSIHPTFYPPIHRTRKRRHASLMTSSLRTNSPSERGSRWMGTIRTVRWCATIGSDRRAWRCPMEAHHWGAPGRHHVEPTKSVSWKGAQVEGEAHPLGTVKGPVRYSADRGQASWAETINAVMHHGCLLWIV